MVLVDPCARVPPLAQASYQISVDSGEQSVRGCRISRSGGQVPAVASKPVALQLRRPELLRGQPGVVAGTPPTSAVVAAGGVGVAAWRCGLPHCCGW